MFGSPTAFIHNVAISCLEEVCDYVVEKFRSGKESHGGGIGRYIPPLPHNSLIRLNSILAIHPVPQWLPLGD